MKQLKWDGGIILNIDINSVTTPFLNRAAEEENFSAECLWTFVDQYADTQVKALAFNTFCQYSATPSKIWTDSVALHDRRMENGVPVRYDLFEYKGIYQFYHRGIDPYAVWMERCRQRGMEAWLSVRMNDCHCPDEIACFLRSDFFYEAREKGWMLGDAWGYNRYCFDYTVPEVRRRMLAYMEEQLDMYDADGLELDFMREPLCFDYLNCPDKLEIMNDFMRDVKKIVVVAEEKWGHKIKVIVRLPREIDHCLIYGFDPETWVREKLVDHINVTPRFETCDNDMPLRQWKERMPSVEISAGIETRCLRNDNGPTNVDSDVVNGLVAAYIPQGVDAIYLYNYYIDPYAEEDGHKRRTEDVIRRCGSGETVFASPRRHIVMYQDIAPKGTTRHKPLPCSLIPGRTETISLPIGYVLEQSKAHLILGFSQGLPENMRITVNGKTCSGWEACTVSSMSFLTTETTDDGYAGKHVKLYKCSIEADNQDRYVILVDTTENAILDYVEITIE